MAKKKSSSKRKQVQKKTAPPRKPSFVFNLDHKLVLPFFLLLISVLVIIIRMNFLDMPFERDEGDYGLAGKLILDGATPYRDVFEQKPPGLFYSYAFIEAIFGTTVKGLHMGFIFVNIASFCFLAYALKNLLNPLAAGSAALVYALITLNPHASGFTVQAEHMLNLFVCASFFFLIKSYTTKKLWLLIVSGALVAWSATIKQNGLFFVIAIVLGVLAMHLAKGKLNTKQLVKEYFYLASGGIGMALFVILLMAALGVWNDFIFWSITFPRERYVSSIPFSQGMEYLKTYYNKISNFESWVWYAAFAGTALVLISRLKWAIKIWMVLIVALAFFSIWPGYRFYGHYWLQLFIGLSIAVGLLAYVIQEYGQKVLPKNIALILPVTILIIFTISSLNKNKNYYFNPNKESIITGIYGDNPFLETRNIANFLKTKSLNPDDKLLVLGSEPQLHFETGMDSPTPHTFITFVASAHPASRQWRTEYIEMIQKNEAKYAVMVFHPFSWLVKEGEGQDFFRDTWSHLQRNYKQIGVADMLGGGNTKYYWDQDAANYNPQGSKYLIVYERRN